MDRRSFLGLLVGLPFVGNLAPAVGSTSYIFKDTAVTIDGVSGMMELPPGIYDVVSLDRLIDEYSLRTGVPPSIIRGA